MWGLEHLTREHWVSISIESILFFFSLGIVVIVVSIARKYPHLTREGWWAVLGGFIIMSASFFFEALDTYIYAQWDYFEELAITNPDVEWKYWKNLYENVDALEQILLIVGLLFVAFGIYIVVIYINKEWVGDKPKLEEY